MTLDPTLQLLALVLTGAVVPLLTYLLSRGPQLRNLNATGEASLVSSATQLATTLQTEVDRLNHVVDRLNVVVADLRTDLDASRRQIDELKAGLS